MGIARTYQELKRATVHRKNKNNKHGGRVGYSSTPTYYSWIAMRQRCFIKSNVKYPQYGGRGITVCERWSDFAAFLSDMGERPIGKFLERKDNEKGYSPDNCKWATREEQGRNMRSSRRLTFAGKTLTVPEWANLLGIPANRIHVRLYKGWSVERTLTFGVENKL